MHKELTSALRRCLRRIARIPRDLRSSEHRGAAIRRLISLICAVILVLGALYTVLWTRNRDRIQRESEQYSQLYTASTATPAPEATQTAAPAATEIIDPETAAPAVTSAPLPQVDDVPLSAPDSDTLLLTLPTAPPVQDSFSALLAENPETVGFLKIGSIVSLPVVQRENDNSYYLSHTFSGDESAEGTLFLDGMNRLVPEDDCLIVYGHNMHNGTMFGNLRMYLNRDYFRKSAPVAFDTLYENRLYVPFAAFNASMSSDSSSYFDVRQFIFDETSFDTFVLKLQSRSEFDVPVDVQYGDRLLLLVTCDYSQNDGRFILALRALLEGETTEQMQSLIAQAR